MTNKELATAWFAAIDAKNFNAVKNLMDKNHKFNNPMTPAPVGIDEHIGMMQMMTSSFDGGHTIDLVVDGGTHVAVRGTYSGKHVADFNGVPSTGKQVTFSWIDIFEVKNGKVANEYFEMNPMSIMMQIGAMPVNA